MKVLQLTVHFSPNLGGVETHLDDLVNQLTKIHQVFVLTYRPLSVNAEWSIWQTKKNVQILRLPWLPGWFNKLAKVPAGEFLYLVPGLFVTLPFILLFFRPDVIHAHGLSAGFVGSFWGKIFRIRTVISTHSIYHFPSVGVYHGKTPIVKSGVAKNRTKSDREKKPRPSGRGYFYRTIAKWVFQIADYNLCLSNQSISELINLGVSPKKIGRFVYWVDLNKFKPLDEEKSKKALGWTDKFIVLFVGRLVPEKGIPELLEAAKKFKPGINLKIAGSGPLESQVSRYYIGRISQDKLPLYYSAANIVIVPSTHEEGFGRVIIESLACGTPVIAANRGAIPEAMDNTVGRLIVINPKSITETIEYYFHNKGKLNQLSKNARKFAVRHYGRSNADLIIDSYRSFF